MARGNRIVVPHILYDDWRSDFGSSANTRAPGTRAQAFPCLRSAASIADARALANAVTAGDHAHA
jgi:hypothetical protein